MKRAALIARADEAKVGKLAPRSLQAAKRYLAEADQEIQRNRYDVSQPRKLAAQARYEARHATYLAQLIERVQKEEGDDQAGIEALILSWEEPLKQIASEMELAAQFDKGMQAPMQEINEHAGQQAQEVRRLKQELADRDDQLTALNTQVQRLESRLGGVSEERVSLQRRVDAQERLRTSVAALESSFTADEARVVRQGDDIVLSLLGIKFPSGRSTIDANSAALMKKVQQGLAQFPGASISVEGHTDANGSDSTNLILSQDRADAVRQYLVSNFGIDPEKVSSVGYGEARPVATNETRRGPHAQSPHRPGDPPRAALTLHLQRGGRRRTIASRHARPWMRVASMKAQLLAAVTLLAVSFGLGAATDDQFVVHEWGTFTTAQGADGEQIDWAPLYSVDLPEFVYSGAGNLGGFQDARQSFQGKDVIAPVRMETPVIYFYSQRERVADVSVLFRGGNVTEWYPQATNLKTQWTSPQPTARTRQFLIEWNGVSILPRDTREPSGGGLIRGKDSSRGNHYYVARETDSNLLRVSSRYASKGIEHERHLFYRGVGWFKAPLTVGIDADEQQLSLTAREAEQIAAAFVVTVRNGMMRFQKIDAAISSATVRD